MIIDIKKLKEGISYYDISETAEKLGIDIEDIKFTTPVKTTVEVNNMTDVFTVRGRVKAGYETNCAKCGVVFSGKVNEDFDHRYVKGEQGEYTVDGEINKDGLDEEILAGDELNLFEDVRQTVLLAVPEKAVCSEKCKGICPGCGKNLNKLKCACKEGEIKPFADLKKLLKTKASATRKNGRK